MPFTVNGAIELLNAYYGRVTAPTNLRIRLMTGSPGAYVELTTGGYASALVANNTTNFPTPTNQSGVARTVNGTTISFGTVTESTPQITAYRVENATTSTVTIEEPFPTPLTFTANQELRFTPGNFVVNAILF